MLPIRITSPKGVHQNCRQNASLPNSLFSQISLLRKARSRNYYATQNSLKRRQNQESSSVEEIAPLHLCATITVMRWGSGSLSGSIEYITGQAEAPNQAPFGGCMEPRQFVAASAHAAHAVAYVLPASADIKSLKSDRKCDFLRGTSSACGTWPSSSSWMRCRDCTFCSLA